MFRKNTAHPEFEYTSLFIMARHSAFHLSTNFLKRLKIEQVINCLNKISFKGDMTLPQMWKENNGWKNYQEYM